MTAANRLRPLAVVTGASSGIGRHLAEQFARHDHDLVIAAEDDAIHAVAAELSAQGVHVRDVQVDLRTPKGVGELYAQLHGDRPVDALALNAGVGEGGRFVEQKVGDVLSIVELNVLSTVHLARLVVADMVLRGEGRVLMSSSIASTMPGSYQAVYNASKSFVQSFAQALQNELRGTGVTITSLMPGPTDTNFFRRADMADNTLVGRGSKDDPAQVAAQAYDALMAGKRRVVGGSAGTRVQYYAGVLLPDRAKAALHSVMAKPRS